LEYDHDLINLIGDAVVGTAFLSYLGPFNREYRSRLISMWQTEVEQRRIPMTRKFNLLNFFADSTIITSWQSIGLPVDDMSTENAIITTRSPRWPFLIDPQSQGRNWVHEMERPNGVKAVSITSVEAKSCLEVAMAEGRPLIIEDVDESTYSSILSPIVDQHFQQMQSSIKREPDRDSQWDMHPSFRLILTTKMSKPQLPTDAFAKLSIINFAVTMTGLEDQLLGRVILKEKKELESQRRELLLEVREMNIALKRLEDNLLDRLTTTAGSLLEDESIVNVLADTKATAAETRNKLAFCSETEKKINTAREEFRSVAKRAALLYFTGKLNLDNAD
jgi:dynein heavy chain